MAKTILKLHANGNFETVGTPLVQSGTQYKFTENLITIPKIIEYPPIRNYLIENTSEWGWINPRNGSVESSSHGAKASDFIDVSDWDIVTIRVYFDKLPSDYKAWGNVSFYDANKGHLETPYEYADSPLRPNASWKFNVPLNVNFIRMSADYFELVKSSVERGETTNQKHYPAPEDLPTWVRDTGNPISIFPQGIVIKGDLIHTEQDTVDPTVLFHDDFADTALSQSLWTTINGDFAFRDGYAEGTQAITNCMVVTEDLGADNIRVSADIQAKRSEGIIFRVKDYQNHFRAQFETNAFVLSVFINGAKTELRRTANVGTPSGVFKLSVELKGNDIRVFRDGEQIMQTTSSSHITEGKHGIMCWQNAVADGTGKFYGFEARTL